MRRKTTQEFIAQARAVHGDRYDYSKVEYKNSKAKVKIVCPAHGQFMQAPTNHVSARQGCPKCGGTGKLTAKEFIAQARVVHGDRYDYSKVEYKNSKAKVKIVCPAHGQFMQRPNDHLSSGSGCPHCGGVGRKSTSEFVTQARIVHGDRYGYGAAVYKNAHSKVIITCGKHGKFKQDPHSHLKGVGCPDCDSSHGENTIALTLSAIGARYTREKTFDDCRDSRLLRYDFWLPDYNTLIEFNGKHHYEKMGVWGGAKALKDVRRKDTIKSEYAQANGISLVVIPYWDFSEIENILKSVTTV